MKLEIVVGRTILGRVKPFGFSLVSCLIFICFIVVANGCCENGNSLKEADVFLGPPLGDTIKIKESGFGIVTRRICTKINDDGSYVIEEWTKLPKPTRISTAEERSKTKLPEGAYYWDDAPEETMYRYILTAENGKLIFNKGKKNENTILDLNNKEWSQYLWSSAGKVKADYVIVKEEKKVVLGKLRKLVHVKYSFDLNGMHIGQLYVVASGLGVIREESLSPGSNKLKSTLIE
ncbi:hypothetical protein [Maridesulfovibrio sp.]|uniref:hypothetical protein n=1 Tax=Maridesulfovibrio sp. TaxID=2795000 RepID=UPI0039F069C3